MVRTLFAAYQISVHEINANFLCFKLKQGQITRAL